MQVCQLLFSTAHQHINLCDPLCETCGACCPLFFSPSPAITISARESSVFQNHFHSSLFSSSFSITIKTTPVRIGRRRRRPAPYGPVFAPVPGLPDRRGFFSSLGVKKVRSSEYDCAPSGSSPNMSPHSTAMMMPPPDRRELSTNGTK